jgi:hypothetical protein
MEFRATPPFGYYDIAAWDKIIKLVHGPKADVRVAFDGLGRVWVGVISDGSGSIFQVRSTEENYLMGDLMRELIAGPR